MQAAISAIILALFSSAGIQLLSAERSASQEFPRAFPRDGATMVLDNARGTVWDVTWMPGKPTLMHRHEFDYVGVELTDTTVNITTPDGTRRTLVLTVGRNYFLPRGTTHIEEVPATSPERHAIIIDLKDARKPESENSTETKMAVSIAPAKRLVENDRVAMWDFTWPSAEPATAVVSAGGAFIVFLEGGELKASDAAPEQQSEMVSAGQVLFTSDGRVLSELSTKGHVRGIVIQLK